MKASFDHTIKNCTLPITIETIEDGEMLLEMLVDRVRQYNDPKAERLLEIVIEWLEHRESEIVI